jgi:acetyl esterase/lipase
MTAWTMSRRQLVCSVGTAAATLVTGCRGTSTARSSLAAETPWSQVPKALRIAYGADASQFGELRLPTGSGPHPVVVVIHGGFWSASYDLRTLTLLAGALTDAGWATWHIEYRRVGNSAGGWPGTLQDVALATDHLRRLASTHPLDLHKVVTLGHSAGGQLAVWLAARRRLPKESPLHTLDPLPLRAAVSLAGVLDLRRAWELNLGQGAVAELLGGSPKDVPDRYAAASPAELLPIGLRQVLLHGTYDNLVPIEISKAYQALAAAKGDDVQLISLPGADHFRCTIPRMAEGKKVLEAVAQLMA